MTNFDEPYWVATYLDELEDHGLTARAARAAGTTSHAVDKYASAHPEFEQARQEALDLFGDTLEQAAVTRAVHGVTKPVFYKGEECGEVQEYSDGLLTTLLKGRRGHLYGDKKEVNFRGDIQIVMAGVAQPLAPGQSRTLQAERAAARTTSLPHPTQAELAHDRVADLLGPAPVSAEEFL